MAKVILYSDDTQTEFAVASTYTLDEKSMAIADGGDFIWVGRRLGGFGKIERATGTITYYNIGVVGGVRGISVSETDNLIFLSILKSSPLDLVVEVRSLSSPNTLLYTHTDTEIGFGCSYDEINNKLYVAYDVLGVKVFHWNGTSLTVDETIVIASYQAYGVSYKSNKLLVSSNSSALVKEYAITQGTPVVASFERDITLAIAQGRGVYYNEDNNTILATHGTTSNSFSLLDYSTGNLINEIFPLAIDQPFGIIQNSVNEVWLNSYNDNKVFKMI